MQCDYCGGDIPEGAELLTDGRYFCNPLHRKMYLEQQMTEHAISGIGSPSAKKSRKFSGKHWGIVVTAIFVAIGSAVGTRIADGLFHSDSSIDKQLMKVAEEINKTCPVVLDRDTRLDNAIAGAGKTFTYSYTLTSWSLEEIDVQQLQSYIRPRVTNAARTSPDMKYFRDNGVTLGYRYLDRLGKFVFDINLAPDEYR